MVIVVENAAANAAGAVANANRLVRVDVGIGDRQYRFGSSISTIMNPATFRLQVTDGMIIDDGTVVDCHLEKAETTRIPYRAALGYIAHRGVVDELAVGDCARYGLKDGNCTALGSCTNGRLSDFQQVAAVLKGRKVDPSVRAIAVPGSEKVDKAARELNLHKIFEEAGFEWRKPGCSMCLAMNPDKLKGDEICASSSNRNFIGRQGSSTGRTILMSPIMVAAAAIEGKVADAREVFRLVV